MSSISELDGSNDANDEMIQNQLPLSETSKKRSRVWLFFEKLSETEARCNCCNKTFKRSANTTNLKTHLERMHLLLWNPPNSNVDSSNTSCSVTSPTDLQRSGVSTTISDSKLNKHPSVRTLFAKVKSFKEGGKDWEQVTNAILYMIVVDHTPVKIVEKSGFRTFIHAVVPHYKIPSRATVTRLLQNRYLTIKDKFVMKVKDCIAFTLTCDNWTDINNQSYLGITAHYLMPELTLFGTNIGVFPLDQSHTAEYLKESLNSVLEEFTMKRSKLMCIVSDSASNIRSAISTFVGPEKQLGCFAHLLSHLVPDAMDTRKSESPELDKLVAIIDKVRVVVKRVKNSTNASDELKRLQIVVGKKAEGNCLKFKKDMVVRWNSTLFMLERFLQLEQYVQLVVRKCREPLPPIPDSNEINILRDCVRFMQILQYAITEISGQSYPTASMIIPLSNCIKNKIVSIEPNTECGRTFKERLLTEVDRRFGNLEKSKLLTLSTYFDPRFKHIHFQKPLTIVNVKQEIKNILQATSRNTPKDIVEPVSVPNTTGDGLWTYHDELVASRTARVTSDPVDFNKVLDDYQKLACLERKTDPLQSWKTLKNSFPELYQIAIRYVCILGTSVPSERLFSKAGRIKTKDRNRLTGKHLNMLMFLASSSKEDWGFSNNADS